MENIYCIVGNGYSITCPRSTDRLNKIQSGGELEAVRDVNLSKLDASEMDVNDKMTNGDDSDDIDGGDGDDLDRYRNKMKASSRCQILR